MYRFKEIKSATAEYMSGGNYCYYGMLEDGDYFIAYSNFNGEYEVSFCDADPTALDEMGVRVSDYCSWMENHAWELKDETSVKEFFVQMLDYIICNPDEDANYTEEDMEKLLEDLSDIAIYVLDPNEFDFLDDLDDDINRSQAIKDTEESINHLLGADIVRVEADVIWVMSTKDPNRINYANECEDEDEVYNTLNAMLEGMRLLDSVRGNH